MEEAELGGRGMLDRRKGSQIRSEWENAMSRQGQEKRPQGAHFRMLWA